MKYTVKFACGHEAEIELFGKTSERERKIAFYEQDGKCPECYKARKEAERAERIAQYTAESEAAAAMAENRGLVELQGSPKQIAWATSIREKWLARWEGKAKTEQAKSLVLQFVEARAEAKFWIDNQYNGNPAAIDRNFADFVNRANAK